MCEDTDFPPDDERRRWGALEMAVKVNSAGRNEPYDKVLIAAQAFETYLKGPEEPPVAEAAAEA